MKSFLLGVAAFLLFVSAGFGQEPLFRTNPQPYYYSYYFYFYQNPVYPYYRPTPAYYPYMYRPVQNWNYYNYRQHPVAPYYYNPPYYRPWTGKGF